MCVVPHAACGGDDEDADGLDEGVAPKGRKDEDVEADQAAVAVVDRSKVVAAVGDVEICGWDQEYHNYQAPAPKSQGEERLEDGDEHGSADTNYELSRCLADSHCQSQSAAAAKSEDQGQSS